MKFFHIDTAEWQRLMFGNERINKRIIVRIAYLIIIKQEMFFLVEYGNTNTSGLNICIFYELRRLDLVLILIPVVGSLIMLIDQINQVQSIVSIFIIEHKRESHETCFVW